MTHGPLADALRRLRSRLPLVGMAVIVFTMAYAAAAQLDVVVTPTPQAGAGGSAITCQETPLTIGYRVDRTASTATAMTVSGLSATCAGLARITLALAPSSAYFAGGVNYVTLAMTDGTSLVLPFASAVPLVDVETGEPEFTTGTVIVTIDATAGVSVTP